MNGSAGTDEEDFLGTERTKGGADFHVKVRIVACVHGDDRCWGTPGGEHADEN